MSILRLIALLTLLLPGPQMLAQAIEPKPKPSAPIPGQDNAASATTDTAPLKPYTLIFDSARNGKQLGETQVTLRPLDGERWEFAFDTRATRGMASFIGFKFREYSVFRWRGGRPETIDYGYAKKTGFNRKRRSLHIDAERRTITGEDDDGKFSIAYQPHLVDRNLTLVAISQDLRAGRSELRYALANKRVISHREFAIDGEETLATSRGPMATVRVVRVLAGPGRVTTLWLAPALDYQPVQVRQVESDGEIIELKLR
ncbi:MAG: DUF3108 domain-containing protein [Lysobacterales bacterium]